MINIEAEQSVIGSILLEGSLFRNLRIQSKHFGDLKHQQIFRAMEEVANKEKSIDIVTVVTQLGDRVNGVGGVSYITDLAGSVPTTANIEHYESAVFESYRNRKSREIALRYAEKPDNESLHDLIHQLSKVSEIGVLREEKTIHDYLVEIVDDMSRSPDESETGFKTNFTDFDEMTGGLQQGDLI